jgi:glyoxylase-like metal-dependent hydrolase (beta-lactamase superfamily II)
VSSSVATTSGGASIVVLGTEQQAAWGRRELPPVEALPGGLWSVPVPIPDNPLRYTLSYLVPGDSGLVVVDPGWDDDETWAALQAGLVTAGASITDVVGIVVTHVHPDHHGLSERLKRLSGAWVAMHPAEAANLPQRVGAVEGKMRHQGMSGLLRSSGASEEDIEALLGTAKQAAEQGDHLMADPDVLLEDGDFVPLPGRRLRTVWTPGHTPGHICLQEPDAHLMLTGDHVLPRISPNIGLHPASGDSPLANFLASLEKVGHYDDHDVLPAHEYRFRKLGLRTRQLIEHHEERCRELVAVVAEIGEPTLWQVAKGLTWSRSWEEIGRMRFAALSETTAHVQYLVDGGELAWAGDRSDTAPGAAAAVRVRLAA